MKPAEENPSKKDDAKQTAERQNKPEEETFVFKVSQQYLPDKTNGVMVDCGATSHIINEINQFTRFDETFNPEKHYMELADGSKSNNVALKRAGVEVLLQDIKGRYVAVTLKNALFIRTYSQNIVSVKAATTDGARVIFEDGQNELITKDGTVFCIEEHERLLHEDGKQPTTTWMMY